MSATLLIALLVLFALMGTPLFAIITAAAMLGFYYADIDLIVIAIELYRIVDTPLLIALPFFTFAGYLLAQSNTSQRLVSVTQALFGWMPGGLAIVAYITCAFFTAFTGASGITIVAIGALLLPALIQAGYSEKFSLGLVTASGSLGLLLAPSLPLILYGIIVQQLNIGQTVEIKDLFIAGIGPSLLMILLLSAWAIWHTRGNKIPTRKISGGQVIAALSEAKWELPLPFVILGGIYSGFFAISEAAAVTALYLLLVEVFVYREIPLKKLPAVIRDSMMMVGGILLILGVSLAFTNFLVDAEIPMLLFNIIQQHISNKFTFLILLNIILLLLGAILDIFSALIIMVPLLLPVAIHYDIHPVHLGIIFLANMQIGYLTPPVGMNLFIASYRFHKPITELYRASLPFIAVLLLALVIITYCPILTLGMIS